jgi:hypothetical protein
LPYKLYNQLDRLSEMYCWDFDLGFTDTFDEVGDYRHLIHTTFPQPGTLLLDADSSLSRSRKL